MSACLLSEDSVSEVMEDASWIAFSSCDSRS